MRKAKIFLKKLYLQILCATRNRKRRSVYFLSFDGQYSDNPRAISEVIHELDPSIELIWRLKEGVAAPDYITKVYSKRLAKKAQVQADAWVMNNNSSPAKGDYKGKHTYFVETWHGDRGFKKVGWAALESMGKRYSLLYELPDLKDVNLFVAGSTFGIRMAHEGFHYYGEILTKGSPRNDKLVNIEKEEAYARNIRKQLGIEDDYKILLYAPTYRDNVKTLQSINVDIEGIINILEAKGEKWVCLVRAHSSSKGLNTKKDGNYIDVTDFGDMADLLIVSDCLITDYSSCACDFVLTGKPCVLAHFDRNNYESNDRSFWFKPDEIGFLIANNQQQLEDIFNCLFQYDHKSIAKQVLDFYGTNETGESSRIVAERIIKWVNSVH